MPRKRANKSSPERKSSDVDDDDFFFDDTQSNSGRSTHEPQHRNAANARERARMRVLSKAFCRLKTTLPWVPADTKLSKLDTLRLAASYIAHLRAILHDEPRSAAQKYPHPLNLAWPFAFQHSGSLSCPVLPRCSSPSNDTSPRPIHESHTPRESPTTYTNIEQYHDYPDEYEKRYYHEDNGHTEQHCGPQIQYSNFGYKNSNYGMRNSYANDSAMYE